MCVNALKGATLISTMISFIAIAGVQLVSMP